MKWDYEIALKKIFLNIQIRNVKKNDNLKLNRQLEVAVLMSES